MKRRSKILTGFIAAAITFASLFAIAGPRHFNGPFGRNDKFYKECHMNHSNMEHSKQPATTDSLKTN